MELKITFGDGKKVNAHVNGHTIFTDQSVQDGGEGSAPAPYDLFLASLGTCAGIYVLGFLNSRKLPIKDVEITQKHSFDPTTFKLTNVVMEVKLPPEVPQKYHRAIARAANMCAVKKTMFDPPAVDVTVN